MSGLSAQERADVASVGFRRGVVERASRGPGPSAGFASSKGSGLRGEHSEAPKNLVRVGTRRCLRG
jgi:hypothetical protein